MELLPSYSGDCSLAACYSKRLARGGVESDDVAF